MAAPTQVEGPNDVQLTMADRWTELRPHVSPFPQRAPRRAATRIVSGVAGVVLAWLSIRVALRLEDALGASLHVDETEHLHAAWLGAQGLRIFRDFFEHHSPFLHAILQALVPSRVTTEFPIVDAPSFAAHARLVVGACGLTTLAVAVWIAHRVFRSRLAAIVTAAGLGANIGVVGPVVGEVRPDPIALMLLWCAIAMLVSARPSPLRTGLSLGFLAASVMVCPKWPVVVLVVGVVATREVVRALVERPRSALLVVAAALPLPALVLAVMLHEASPGDLFTFVIRFNASSEGPTFAADIVQRLRWLPRVPLPFRECRILYRPWTAALLLAPVALALVGLRGPRRWPRPRRGVALIGAIAIAALVEVRFVFPYPVVHYYYYAMWCLSLGVLYGGSPRALSALLAVALPRSGPAARWGVGAAATIAALSYDDGYEGRLSRNDFFRAEWPARESWIQQRLHPEDLVWIRLRARSVAGFDASYYWGMFGHVVPAALRQAARDQEHFPALKESDLPVCELLRGGMPRLRFLSLDFTDFFNMPTAYACARGLIEAQRLCLTGVRGVFEVRREGQPCVPFPKGFLPPPTLAEFVAERRQLP